METTLWDGTSKPQLILAHLQAGHFNNGLLHSGLLLMLNLTEFTTVPLPLLKVPQLLLHLFTPPSAQPSLVQIHNQLLVLLLTQQKP
jgi:hypothetical protein